MPPAWTSELQRQRHRHRHPQVVPNVDPGDPTDDMVIQGTVPRPRRTPAAVDPYRDGRCLTSGCWTRTGPCTACWPAGAPPARTDPARRPLRPRQASNGNIVDENGEFPPPGTAPSSPSDFVPEPATDTLIPVFMAVKDLNEGDPTTVFRRSTRSSPNAGRDLGAAVVIIATSTIFETAQKVASVKSPTRAAQGVATSG